MPKVEGHTQARRLGEAELMARELIALETAQPIGDIDVCIQVCLDSGGRSLSHRVDRVRQDLAALVSAQAVAEAELEQIGREMDGAEISLREIGEFLVSLLSGCDGGCPPRSPASSRETKGVSRSRPAGRR